MLDSDILTHEFLIQTPPIKRAPQKEIFQLMKNKKVLLRASIKEEKQIKQQIFTKSAQIKFLETNIPSIDKLTGTLLDSEKTRIKKEVISSSTQVPSRHSMNFHQYE